MTVSPFCNQVFISLIISYVLLHCITNAFPFDCLNEIGFQFIQSNLDLSNVSKIHISVAMFAVDTNFTATTFERATFTIEPYDGDEIVISSNPPNLYKIKFFGGDGYKVTDDDNDGFVNEEDTTTLAFERINQAEVKSVSKIRLVIQFPRYQLLDLYVNTDKSTVNVLPGFNNLKSIQTIIGVKLNAQLTAPVTNFTLDNGVYHSNESQLGNSTFFTVETDKNSTTSSHSVILLNYNPQIFIGEPQESSRLYNLAIRAQSLQELHQNISLTHGRNIIYLLRVQSQTLTSM